MTGDPDTITQEPGPDGVLFDAEPVLPATEPAEPEMVPDHDLVGALEAVLLVVDAPVTESALADRGRPPAGQGPGTAGRPGRPLHGRVLRDRAARARRRLAVLHPRPVRPGGRALRAGRCAEPAVPGRPGNPGGCRLPAAGDPGPDRRGPRRERRRRHPHPDVPWPDRRRRCRPGHRWAAVPDHRPVPGTAWLVRSLGDCHRSGRCCPTSTGSTMSDARTRAESRARRRRSDHDRPLRATGQGRRSRRGRRPRWHPAAEGAGVGRRRLPPQGRGADPVRPGQGRRHRGQGDGHADRPGRGRRARRRQPGRAARRSGLPGAEQDARHALDHVRRAGPAEHRSTAGGPARSGCSTSAGWTWTPRVCCC